MAESAAHSSSWKQLLQSIATIKGDLSNITAPPFVLADKSTTEFPRYWIEHPELFYAVANENDPAKRMLAVLKWFLASLKGQQYAGREPSEGIKKPLNAFLGEVFVGECGPTDNPTRLVSEQVSHHPPVTACYLWNDSHGVRAEGYTRQQITFSGTVNITQIGHAVLHVDRFDEDYLIPLPNIKVKGLLTGGPYPELHGTYSIVGSNGHVAEIDFEGKGFLVFGGHKNCLHAKILTLDDNGNKSSSPLYTAEGSWAERFEFKDESGQTVDEFVVSSSPATEFRTETLDKQDPWESRKAWNGVIEALHKGDMQGVADAKSALENAQREMRKTAATSEQSWEALFFRREQQNTIADRLLEKIGLRHNAADTEGCWRIDRSKAEALPARPWRGKLTPFG